MTAITRCQCAMSRKFGQLLCGRMCSLKLKIDVYWIYIRPSLLNLHEVLCLRESEMRSLQWTEGSVVRAMCGMLLRDQW